MAENKRLIFIHLEKFSIMKKLLLLSGLVSTVSFAQISLTESHFPIANEDFIMSIAIDPSIDYMSTGANFTWDFSGLTSTSQKTISTNPMSQAGQLSNFFFGSLAPVAYRADYFASTTDIPIGQLTSQLPITIDDVSLFTNNTSAAINSIGYELVFSGQGIPAKSDTIETRYVLPLNFGDSYQSRGYTRLNLNPIYDAEWKQYRTRSSQVDGWGSISTPFGTFDALRIHHTITEFDSIYITLDTIGFWIPLDVPETHEYEWRSTSDKEAILRIRTNVIFGNETVTAIEYRDNYLALDENSNISVMISPNPVTEELVVSAEQPLTQWLIVASNGAIVSTGVFDLNLSPKVDVRHLTSGTYTLIVRGESGIHSTPFVKQ
jgi:hypothetical protein